MCSSDLAQIDSSSGQESSAAVLRSLSRPETLKKAAGLLNQIDYMCMHYSSAYLPNREMMSLKQRVHAFKGGTLVMTMPPPPHRCPPSPYERACLIAAIFKRKKIPGKVVILDPKPRLAPISVGQDQSPCRLDQQMLFPA